jgi:ribosomal protein S18 acetylase RimI-like enzyme
MSETRIEVSPIAGVTFTAMSALAAETIGPSLAKIDPWARYAYTPDALTAFLAAEEPGSPRFAINSGRAIAGAFAIKENWLRGPYLQFLGLLPAFQAHGIGSAVLAWFETRGRDAHAQNLWVVASEFNERALSFYEKHGFRRVAPLTDLVVEGCSEILLRKKIAPN